MILFKKSGLGIQDSVISANEKYLSSLCTSIKLIGAVTGASEFSTTIHLQAVKEERCDGKKNWDDGNEVKLEVILCYGNRYSTRCHRIL